MNQTVLEPTEQVPNKVPAAKVSAAAGVYAQTEAGAAADPTIRNSTLDRLDRDVAQTLTDAQRDAIVRAFGGNWGQHAVNIRLSLPWIGGRFFTTIVAGMEQRGAIRRRIEREFHPLKTAGNLFFVIGLGTIFYIGAIIALALQSSIIEF